MATTDYEALARYFGGQAKGPSSVDIAKYIVLNAENQKPLGPGMLKGGNKPSLMSRVFDILSRPNYAVANLAKGFVKGDPDFADFGRGLLGWDKTTFSDVLQEAGVPNSPQRSFLGFTLDVALDPLSYIPIGGAASKVKGLVKNPKPAENIGTALKGEPVFPETFGLPTRTAEIPKAFVKPELPQRSLDLSPSTKIQTSQPTLPGFETRLRLPEVTPKAVKDTPPVSKGQLSFKLPEVKATAKDIVQGVSQGNIPAVARIAPMPKPRVEPRHQIVADSILNKWSSKPYSSRLNEKFPETLNARQQVALYQKARELVKRNYKNPNSKGNRVKVDANTYKVYLALEQALENKGLIPRIGTGENVRMSDVIQHLGGPGRASEVINEFGSEIRHGSPTWEAIESLRAAGAIDDTRSVKLITEKAVEAHQAAKQSMSNSQLAGFEKFLKKFSSATARTQNVSPAGIRTTEKLVELGIRSGKSAAQIAVESKRRLVEEVLAKGKANPELNRSLTKALERDLGTLPKWAVDDNKATEFFMGRLATWWGQKDLRPMSLNAIASAQATATARGKALDDLFAPFDQAQRHEAFKLAQGFGTASSVDTGNLASRIKQMMDNLTGRASVITNSAIHRDIVNKWMKRYEVGFEFTSGKVKTITGETIDFSKGSDWLQSWKVAKIEDDPKAVLFRFQQALEQATREKALFDEVGERFGSLVPGKGHSTKISGYPYIEGYYFPSAIAKQLPRVVRDWSIPSWQPGNKLLQFYDRVLSMWKSGVTIYRPAHHIRNMVGDVYLGWMDGVNTVRPYMLAAKVQRVLKNYDDLADVDQLVEIGALSRNFATPNPNQVLFTNRSGVGFTAEQIGAVAHQKGLLEYTSSIEDIIDLGEKSRFKPFGGKVQGAARGASELQSHNARLAHFIDKVIKSRGSNLEEIFEQAARRSRKWHPTGLDLTPFEKKYLRRLIPFYSWIRKSTPLLIEGLVMNPGKAVIPAKLYDAIQESQGIETPGRHDPFPVDQMFPEWIRAQGVGPVSLPDGFLGGISSQVPPGYVMGGVGLNPLSDLMAQLESPGRTAISSVTPAIQIPIELTSGRKLFTGEPISGPEARSDAMEQYIGEHIPVYSAFQGISGITPFGTETKKSARSGGPDLENLINWLTAAGIKGTGPYIQSARYEKLAPLNTQKKQGREAFLNELRRKLDGNT